MDFVMSAETAAKKSFLTRLMETTARNKQDGEASDENANPGFVADKKKFATIAVAATVGTAAAIALSWKALSKMAPVEEETSEDTASED